MVVLFLVVFVFGLVLVFVFVFVWYNDLCCHYGFWMMIVNVIVSSSSSCSRI